jgi:hypothetical protein
MPISIKLCCLCLLLGIRSFHNNCIGHATMSYLDLSQPFAILIRETNRVPGRDPGATGRGTMG